MLSERRVSASIITGEESHLDSQVCIVGQPTHFLQLILGKQEVLVQNLQGTFKSVNETRACRSPNLFILQIVASSRDIYLPPPPGYDWDVGG